MLLVAALAVPRSTLRAQTGRDSLMAGRRAYDAVDYASAARLLPVGLARTPVSDTSWAVGAHMLLDALLDHGDSLAALLWARWIVRTAPALAIDSTVFPPRVARTLLRAKAAVTPGPDSILVTTLDRSGDTAQARGMLRLARVSGVSFAVLEGVGTILPGEARTLPVGTTTIRVSYDRGVTVEGAREILPGMTTIITPRSAPAPAAVRPAEPPPVNAPAIRGPTLTAGRLSNCALLAGGAVACWGDNSAGQLGGGFADTTTRGPVEVALTDSLRTISAGALHACGLTAAGKAWCWGVGPSGELGTGQPASSSRPVAVTGGQVFVQLAAGGNHTCGLSSAGAILCWGSNRSGQLGNRTNANALAPTAVAMPNGVSFTAITAGAAHTCALASNGSAWCWGANGGGQLGNGSTSESSAPVVVQSSVPFRTIAAGGSFTCALTPAGAAWCWGANSAGQLGMGATDADQPRPTLVTGGLTFDSLVAGEAHACGITHDGAAYCWGAGRAGQLGNGQMADSPRPVLVVGGDVMQALSLGMNHSCALSADGVTRCWGANAQGQLGALGGRGSALPVPVVARPAARPVTSGLFVVGALRERFDDNDWTAAPAWHPDSAPGVRLTMTGGAVSIARRGGRGAIQGAGLTLPVHIPVTRTTQVRFDVLVEADSVRRACGLNCAAWPAVVRLRVRNSDLTESEAWYAYGTSGGSSHTLGSVVIVAKGDAPAGTWLRDQQFTIRDALPRADTILQVSIGGIGSDFGARFDNLFLPVPVLTHLAVHPDSIVLTASANRQPLTADARDAGGAAMPWVQPAWTSSDTLVATVDTAGVVTGRRTGRAIVRATAGAVGDSVIVKVTMTPVPRVRPAPRRPARRPR